MKREVTQQDLLWINSVRHIGTTITDAPGDMAQDLLEKRAQCMTKNNELMQEFH